jgi:hypothetical protein
MAEMQTQRQSGDQPNPDLSLLHYEVPRFAWVRGRMCSVIHESIDSVRERWIKEGLAPPRASGDLALRNANVSQDAVPHRLLAGESRPVPHENRPPEVLVCEGEGEEYHPLEDAPKAYLTYASIGRLGSRPPVWPAVAESQRSERECEELAEAWPAIERVAVRFVETFGLPRPGLLGLESYAGVPLIDFYMEAYDMAVAVDILAVASAAEHQGDYSGLEQRFGGSKRKASHCKAEFEWLAEAKLMLIWLIRPHLGEVRLDPTIDVKSFFRGTPPIPLVPAYTCDSLLTAMWLQVYFAATERRIVRERCKGCGNPFEARDKRQEYCDKWCRHATNQRDHYRRTRERKSGGKPR